MVKLMGKQQEVLYLPETGHNVVWGCAGSGKSLCAVKRAEYLSKLTNEKVLILSYNNSLINYLEYISGEILDNVTLLTYHKFATAYMRKRGLLSGDSIIGNKKVKIIEKCWKERSKGYRNKRTLEMVVDEIKWLEGSGALSREKYLEIERIGRGKTRLREEARNYIFDIYEDYINERKRQGYKYDWDDLAYYFNKDLEETNYPKLYKHIIIDEGQDFSACMLNSIVNYIGDEGSVIFFGDRAQQIYGKGKSSWKSLGFSIRKAMCLDENHRNTIQIEALANELREIMQLDDDEIQIGTNAVRNGEEPKVIKFNDNISEDAFVIEEASKESGNNSVAIILRNNSDVDDMAKMLSSESISYTIVDRNTKKFGNASGIFLGTFHSMKGLEFDTVFLPKCNDADFKTDKVMKSFDDDYEINSYIAKMLYVGITRAKEKVYISYTDEIVSVLPKKYI